MYSSFFKTILGFISLTSVSISELSAQKQNSDWKEITIIKKNNDTIHGSIFYKHRFKSYNSLSVKTKGETISKFYHPRDVSSFIIKTDEETLFFKTLITDADYSTTDVAKLTTSPKTELVHDTVFGQLLLQGARSVYYYQDDKVFKDHFLIETTDGKATDLVNKHYYLNDSKTTVAYSQEYKRQLMLLLASPSIPASRIDAIAYKRKHILPLVKDYNATVATVSSIYEYKEEKAVFKFGVVAGANLTSLKFDGNLNYLNELKFDRSIGVNAGIMMNIILPGTHKRWSVYNELLYSAYSMESTNEPYVYHDSKNSYRTLTQASIDISYLKLFTAARYQIPGRLTPYVQLGVVNGYAFKNTTSADYETYFYSMISKESKTPFIEFRKYEQSLFGGVGAIVHKVGVELRYEIGNGFSSRGLGSKANYAYVLLNYTF
jgi:hypothetical protein